MTLAELLGDCPSPRVFGPVQVEITGLCSDSRRIGAGNLFIALPGAKTDGNRHAREALAAGAAAVLSELSAPPPPSTLPGTWIQVDDVLGAMARLADAFFNRPSSALTVVGVTGTNGKTTTTYLLESIVRACGGTPGVIGTVDCRLAGTRLAKSVNTTPISLELTRLLARFRDGGASHALLEVSSHALALQRVEAVDFDAAVFLNIARDHLDFHRTPEAYFEAKARLFDLLARPDNRKPVKIAALNADDPHSPALERRAIGCEVVSFGMTPAARDLRGSILSTGLDGSRFSFDWRRRRLEGRIRLPGPHNVSNALAAAAAMLGLGAPPEKVLAGLDELPCVPGRLESIDEGQDFHVLVDYAHTDSALDAVLNLLQGLPHARIITVFGCGGDRDKSKRAPMGLAACRRSDQVFITSDNPRSEDPQAILEEIAAGARAAGLQNYRMLVDRQEAIYAAVAQARTGDVVLVAGKGHEDLQFLRDRAVAFDDRQTARAALRQRKR